MNDPVIPSLKVRVKEFLLSKSPFEGCVCRHKDVLPFVHPTHGLNVTRLLLKRRSLNSNPVCIVTDYCELEPSFRLNISSNRYHTSQK